jgi:hypothetical protein
MSDNPRKLFPLQLTSGKVFNISVSQINKIFGWIWNSKLRVRISATLIVLLKMLSTIRIKLKITSRLSSLYRFADTIKVSRVRTVYTVRMLMKVIQPFVIKYPKLTIIFKMIMRMTQTIKVSRVRIAYTVTLAQFILLGSHDYSDYPTNTSPRTLGNRDTLTLGNMDGTYL